jgi:hypothetical protein
VVRLLFAIGALAVAMGATGCRLDRAGLNPELGLDSGNLPFDGGGGQGGNGQDGNNGCACSPCQRCASDGTCELDPASRWEIWCVSAGVTATPSGLESWDQPGDPSTGTAPDPYCQFDLDAAMVVPASTGITPTMPDTFTPSWNQPVIAGGQTISGAELTSATAKWLLTVGDDDGCTPDVGCIGQPICQLGPPMDPVWLSDGMVTVQGLQSCRTLSLKLLCKP